MSLNPDDIVIVRVKAFSSDRKVTDKWEQIIEQIKDKLVFKVQPVDATNNKRDRVLHRNMLFPLQTVRDAADSILEESTILSQANNLMNNLFEL